MRCRELTRWVILDRSRRPCLPPNVRFAPKETFGAESAVDLHRRIAAGPVQERALSVLGRGLINRALLIACRLRAESGRLLRRPRIDAKGQNRTRRSEFAMSDLRSKADIRDCHISRLVN
jgi:hypothetical protein